MTHEGKVVTVDVPWSGKMNGFTLLFESLLLQLCKHMPESQVEKITKVSDDKLWNLLDLYIETARAQVDCSDLSVVGMDETCVKRAHDYITLFVDLEKNQTLPIAQGKDNQTVKEFAQFLVEHAGQPEQISDVSCDMSPAFIKGVRENLPQAQITFDKFHLLKIINEGVDKVRREEAKTNPLLKNTRYIFLKNEQNLTAKQREKKQELLMEDLNLKAMQALNMRETFQQIYQAKTEEDFTQLLQQWLDWVGSCGLSAMEKVAQCVKNHWDGIVAWKKSQINNGILEGLNCIIQAAKRKARAYQAKHFATMTYLLTGKLNFSIINPLCKHT